MERTKRVLIIQAHLRSIQESSLTKIEVEKMAKILRKLGFEVHILTGAPGEVKYDADEVFVVKIPKWFKPRGLWYYFVLPFFLVKLQKKFGYSFWINHLSYVRIGLISGIVAKLFKVPVVIRIVGYEKEAWRDECNILDKILIWFEYRLLKKVAFSLATIVTHIVNTPQGVDVTKFRPVFNREKNPSEFTILFIGRLDPIKRIDVILEGFKIFSRKNKNSKLVIVGSGELEKFVQEYIKREKLNVELRGFIPNYLLHRIYNSCDVFVLTSKSEGLPNTMLEAFACGKPVIISNIPHLAEIVDRKGVVLTQVTPTKLSEALFKLYESPALRYKLGKYARKYSVTNYSLQACVEKWANRILYYLDNRIKFYDKIIKVKDDL